MLYRKRARAASEAAVPQDVKVNADSLKNTETQAPEAERPQTQNTNLEYPDDPRARLAEEFSKSPVIFRESQQKRGKNNHENT